MKGNGLFLSLNHLFYCLLHEHEFVSKRFVLESNLGSTYREAEELAEVEAKLVGFLTADSHLIYFSRPFLTYLYDLIRMLIGRLTQEPPKRIVRYSILRSYAF